jgi:serine/threonine protein phosphatase PrpC
MDHLSSSLKVNCAQLSQAALIHKGIVAVLADGVSSAEAGREASQACVQNLLYDYYCTPDTWTVTKSTYTVLQALNRWLFSQGQHLNSAEKGYITTLSILILKNTSLHIFHIGDSRIYRIRDNTIEQLTNDHTRQVGKIKYLARAMGLDNKIEIDCRQENLKRGDIFILSSDGLHDFYSEKNWPELIHASKNLDQACQRMLDEALQAGSDDNISCQILQIEELGNSNEEEFFKNLSKLAFPPLLEKQQVIDGLTVISTLYESARSQLYVVEDSENGQRYVMKTPSPNFEDDPAYIERFIMESWLGRRFRNNKLVKVIHREKPNTYLYYLMEFVEGVSLEEWMKKNEPCSPNQAIRIIRQIALGLRYLHRQQVIHQDLKPSNILIDDNEQIKLVDYGSCYLQSAKELPQIIKMEQALGTASYSAPECHLGKKIDARSDLFSLAIILYELITGTLPYKGKLENLSKESDLEHFRYSPAHLKNPYLPRWFDACLEKALSVDPDKRYGDIDEFIYELENGGKFSKFEERVPLIARDPLKFWKTLALIQTVLIVLLSLLVMK